MPPKVPEEDVLDDIRRVADKLGKVPTRSEYGTHGQWSEALPRIKFGSWSAAREAAGLEGGATKNEWIDRERVIQELRDVAEKIGHAPSQAEFNEYAGFSHQVAYERFGSFNDAKEAAGLETRYDSRIPDSELLDDISSVAEEFGTTPSQRMYDKHGSHGLTVVKRHFGSWGNAVRRAGYEPRTVGPPTGEENPAYEGGYDNYYGPSWTRKRTAAIQRDRQCRLCGISFKEHLDQFGEELSVHHIKRFDEFDDHEEANKLTNLICLCRPCHSNLDEGDPQTREKLRKLVGRP